MQVSKPPAFLFDLDGTLVDSVYPHVLAGQEALERCGIDLSVARTNWSGRARIACTRIPPACCATGMKPACG